MFEYKVKIYQRTSEYVTDLARKASEGWRLHSIVSHNDGGVIQVIGW